MDTRKDLKNIVTKFLEGESNPAELEEAIDVFSDPYHNLDLRPVVFELWRNQNPDEEIGLSKEENQRLLDIIHYNISLNSEVNSIGNTRKIFKKAMHLAAILLVGFVLGVLVNTIKRKETTFYTTKAPAGAISQVVLADKNLSKCRY